MKNALLRSATAGTAFFTVLAFAGCRKVSQTLIPSPHSENTSAYQSDLQPLVAASTLPGLRWPIVSDVQPQVQKFYEGRNYELAWTREGKPTAQATAFIKAIEECAAKGLNPSDYDGERWPERTGKLSAEDHGAIAQFDVAMTATVLRFLNDLHAGRINPTHLNFEIDAASKALDAQFLTDKAVDASDVPALVSSLEPDSELYRQTLAGLSRYMDLAKQQQTDGVQPLPTVEKAVVVNGSYPAIGELWKRLQLEGDAPSGEAPAGYTQPVADAVRAYQHRHGITEDGKLTGQTIKSLNVPMSERVTQLQNSLERWRWLPEPYVNPRLLVNLPEFLLRGFDESHHLDFSMKVVDGKSTGGHNTAVFTHTMKYLIFRPYWNVPVDIAKKELVPHMNAKEGYLASKNYEVTTSGGVVRTDYTTYDVAHGRVMVREKPGPRNSLGLVKFMFPNVYDIYLHSTPEVQLFNRTRRDYSHGCVRVQEPEKLADWVLQGDTNWDADKVHEAMETGEDNKQVNLKKQLPVVMFYLTAIPADDDPSKMHFFDDIYGYDAAMQSVLAKGMPYPKGVEKISPTATDTH